MTVTMLLVNTIASAERRVSGAGLSAAREAVGAV
jgi:hypothetical protein